MNLDYFRWDHQGQIATITFNRPERRNGLDIRVMRELEGLIHRARDDGDIRILIITGTGTAFCAGADLSLGRDAPDDATRARHQAELNQVPRIIGRLIDTMTHMDVVTIGAINGFAVGGGWSLATGFDHVVAVEGAQFWVPEVEIGMPFRGLANIKLTQRLGPALAREAMILCRRFTAEELLHYRVINQVCPPGELEAEVRRVAEAYLAMPWRAAIATRRDINAAVYGPQHY